MRSTFALGPLLPVLLLTLPLLAADPRQNQQTSDDASNGNKPERLEWLQDAGFGMFIHWSLDSQSGSVISHIVTNPHITMRGDHRPVTAK